MIIAIWIIAICEVIRAAQNMLQIAMYKHDAGNRDNAYAEFVKRLKGTDEEFVENMLREFEKTHPATTRGAVNHVVPAACKNCPNHPSNGGSGNCNCILGMTKVTC